MFGIIAVSLSVLVILAGLSMLAKSKKESLGKLYTFSSYAAIFIGLGLFIGGNIGGMKRLCHANGGSCSSSSFGHKGPGACASFSAHQGGGGCSSHASFGHGSYGNGSSCGHGGKSSCSHGEKSSCSSKGHGYGHGSCEKSSCSHGGKKHKKVCKKYSHHGEGEGNIETEVEIEEVDEVVEEIN